MTIHREVANWSSTSSRWAMMMHSWLDDHTWGSWRTCLCNCLMSLPDETPFLATWFYRGWQSTSLECPTCSWLHDYTGKARHFVWLDNHSWQSQTTCPCNCLMRLSDEKGLLAIWHYIGRQWTCPICLTHSWLYEYTGEARQPVWSHDQTWGNQTSCPVCLTHYWLIGYTQGSWTTCLVCPAHSWTDDHI